MEWQAAPPVMRLRRWLRGYWPSRNALRRRCDRAEAMAMGLLLVAFLVAGGLAAILGGRLAYAAASGARHAELAQSHEVPAVLLTAAAQQQAGYVAVARAWWRAPDGRRRTGQVFLAAGTPAGSTVRVWVDAAGQQVDPPLRPSQVQGQAMLTAVLCVMAVAVLLWSAGLAVRGAANRRRMAAWDDEWRAVGPRWSRHG